MRAVPLLRAALFIGYVALAWSSTFGAPAVFDAVAVGCIGSAIWLPALLSARPAALAAWSMFIMLLVLAAHAGYARLPGYFAPPLILGAMAALFGRTLKSGTTPLVSRFVRALDGAEFAARPKIVRYARAVTLAWTVLLSALALASFVLALIVWPDGAFAALGLDMPFALSPAAWGLAVSFGGYGVMALAFVLEFALRRVVLPEAPRRRFGEFARRMAGLWPELRKP